MDSERKRLNRVWHAMRSRCENPENPAFHNYGGRGIFVSTDWQNFDAFFADMSPRPQGGTIDRIDNNGPYSRDNCRWADRKTQCRNRRGNVLIEFEGRTMTMSAWADELDIPASRLQARIARGRTPQAAVAMGRGRCTAVSRPPRSKQFRVARQLATHCQRGHEFPPASHTAKDGHRCRVCANERSRRHKAKKAARALPVAKASFR